MIRQQRVRNQLRRGIYIDWPGSEAIDSFPCFGGQCSVLVIGRYGVVSARAAALRSKRRLLDWHHQFSRFEPDSELSRRSKPAPLSGPDGARGWLSHGGVVNDDDTTFDVFEPSHA